MKRKLYQGKKCLLSGFFKKVSKLNVIDKLCRLLKPQFFNFLNSQFPNFLKSSENFENFLNPWKNLKNVCN